MAKHIQHGKRFEEDFRKSIPARCDVTRLKDGGGWSNATNMRFTSNNPCDMIVYSQVGVVQAMYKLELKTVKDRTMPFSNIKDHQLSGLYDSAMKGVLANFVVNFRGVNETYMISAGFMLHIIKTCGRKSLTVELAKQYGRLIPQTIKISRYRYELDWL